MKLFQLERRPTSITNVGKAAMTGVFLAVGLMFLAPWIVAWDYQSIQKGDKVNAGDSMTVSYVRSVSGDAATVESRNSDGSVRATKTVPVSALREL